MTPQTNGTTGPPSLKDNRIWISREKQGIATRFLSRCRIEEKDTKTGKVAKGKRTNARYKQYQIT